MRSFCAMLGAMALACGVATAEEVSTGLVKGDGIGAYTVEKAAGNPNDGVEVGKSLCYRCKMGSRPMVMVFARTADDNLASLVTELDKTVAANSASKLGAFVNFLGADAGGLKTAAVAFEKKAKTENVALVVPADQPNGPKDYKLCTDADVTVLVVKEGKVTSSYAFAKGKLDKTAVASIVSDATKLVN